MMNPTYWEQWQFKSEKFSCCRASRIKYSGANCEVFEDDDNASVLVSFLHLFLREGKLIIAWASLTYDTCPKWHEHASFVKKYGKCDHFPKHETQWTKLFKIHTLSCIRDVWFGRLEASLIIFRILIVFIPYFLPQKTHPLCISFLIFPKTRGIPYYFQNFDSFYP